MLTKVEIRPNTGSPLEINTVDGSGNPVFPLHTFEINTNIDSKDFRKMAAPGQWPSFAYPDAMTIHAEGNIVGVGANDAARATSYITQRIALADAALPPVTLLTARIHGVLRVRMDGMTEDADAQIHCTAISIPMASMFPANSEYMLTWKGFQPFFTGVSTSTVYQLG
jgi:hypothetical protein